MKVLQVNVVYKNGSTGKIVNDIHNVLQENGIESIVCYGRGRKIKETNVYKTSSEILAKFNNVKSRITGIQYNGSYLASKKLINIIKSENPDIVHLHCLNGFFINIYKVIKFLKKHNIKTVLTLHAEFMYTGNCSHAYECEKWKIGCGLCPNIKRSTNSYLIDNTSKAWKMMKKSFEGFEDLAVVSVSPWLKSRAEESLILGDKKHSIVLNGIETSKIFNKCNYEYLKEKHKLSNEKIILHVTADFNSEYKGGKYIIDLAKRMKNIKFIIIGNKDKKIELPDNIIDIGIVDSQYELAKYYSMADLTVITSKRETFSMVCAESLACGTPVVGFKAGGPEQISLSKYSEFVDYGNISLLEKVIEKWIDKKKEFDNSIIFNAKEKYSKEKMCNEYIKIYYELFKE